MKCLDIEYCFEMDDGHRQTFKVCLDPELLENLTEVPDDPPDWTQLVCHQCPNCPLQPEEVAQCPAAVNMVGIVDHFTDLLSHHRTRVVVSTAERNISNTTTMQKGICSLMGLLMATSGCPRTSFFKPMARFHLPFASTEETIWRATSTYLLAQYFKLQEGSAPDILFEGLIAIYDDVQMVNKAFAERLRYACRYDSMVNAIILLDLFAKSMPLAIDASLMQINHLFAPYLSHNNETEVTERDTI